MARILIVDDEQDVREMLRDALLLREHEVDLASDAATALQSEKSTHGFSKRRQIESYLGTVFMNVVFRINPSPRMALRGASTSLTTHGLPSIGIYTTFRRRKTPTSVCSASVRSSLRS